ncbi:MAG: hypothetical protein SNG49_07200, partial [Rikenellaceae bacterium]
KHTNKYQQNHLNFMVDLPEIAVSWGYAYFGCIRRGAPRGASYLLRFGALILFGSSYKNRDI